MRNIKVHFSTKRLPFILAPLGLAVLCLVSVTGFANELPKNKIVATIPIGPEPNSMVVSPDSNYVYITNSTGNTGIVQVIATATNTITATITLGTGSDYDFPDTLAITPDGSTLYVAEFDGTTIWVINTATQQITTTLNTVGFPQGMAVTPDGTELYVCNAGTVTIIDTATNELSKTITLGTKTWAQDVVFTPNGSKAYITNLSETPRPKLRYLSVVDTATESVVAKIVAPGFNAGEVMDPKGGHLFLSFLNSIEVINTSNNQVVKTLTQTFDHLAPAITRDGGFLYMVSGTNRDIEEEIKMIEVATGQVAGKPIKLSYPIQIAIAPNGKFAYVFANLEDQEGLFVVDIRPS